LNHPINDLGIPPDSQRRETALTTLDVGLRYKLRGGTRPATLRASITNLTNAFGWRTSTSGAMTYNEPFRALLSVTADY
jgi:hypothetical protein